MQTENDVKTNNLNTFLNTALRPIDNLFFVHISPQHFFFLLILLYHMQKNKNNDVLSFSQL